MEDPRTVAVVLTGRMIAGETFVTAATATLLPSGKVLLVCEDLVEIYDPPKGEWKTTASPAVRRRCHTATLLLSGKVLIVGGFRAEGNEVLASAELYDPDTESWTTTGSLGSARTGHTATLMPSGDVLVTGGQVLSFERRYLDSTELYNPSTRRWTEGARLTGLRAHHTATLLPSGRVLCVGGAGDLGVKLASAELYGSGRHSGKTSPSITGPPMPLTGVVEQQVYGFLAGSAPLEIVTGADGFHYLVKVKDGKTGSLILKAFIRSGETAKLSVPLGNFNIRYAAGRTWLGEQRLFGPSTVFARADQTFTFAKGGKDETFKGFKLELWVRPGGNLRTAPIRREDF